MFFSGLLFGNDVFTLCLWYLVVQIHQSTMDMSTWLLSTLDAPRVGMMLVSSSSLPKSYPHPKRKGTVLHTLSLCLRQILDNAHKHNIQITLTVSGISVACARLIILIMIRLNHSPQSFIHETSHTRWERSHLS